MKRHGALAIPGACAAALNLFLVGFFLIGLKLPTPQALEEIPLVLQPIRHADIRSAPSIPDIDLPVLQIPDIVIASSDQNAAPAALASSIVLAPRPDPAHPNPAPSGVTDARSAPTGASLLLKILVLPDGAIADASIIRSSGQPEVDANAIAFVKAQWKFLPALVQGKPIPYWTTVTVRLS